MVTKAGMEIDPSTGEKIEELLWEIMVQPAEVVERIKN